VATLGLSGDLPGAQRARHSPQTTHMYCTLTYPGHVSLHARLVIRAGGGRAGWLPFALAARGKPDARADDSGSATGS
jgi:hypothetical protein